MRIAKVIASLALLAVLAPVAGAEDFSPTKIRLRRDSSGQGDNSVLRMQGFLVTVPPGDVFNPLNGVTIHVTDAIDTDVTVTWNAADCIDVNGKTKCLAGGQKFVKLDVKPIPRTPNSYQVIAKVRQLGLVGPFNGPVTITVTEVGSGVDRVGTITDCVLRVTGISCRAF